MDVGKILFSLPKSIVGTFVSGLFFLVLSTNLLAQTFEHDVPVWQQQGGEKVLLAATNKRKEARKKKRKKKRRSVRRPSRDFDHLLTGFPLFGSHVNVDCGDCHRQGILKGTPTQCAQCHGYSGQRASSFKPSNHISTNKPCDQCHNENVWIGAKFDHSAVAPGTCTRCHNGGLASGKPGGHPVTNLSCDSCHRTAGWIPAKFKHGNVAPGSCASCHGVTATGKPQGHVATTLSCDDCHSQNGWLPAAYKHTNVAPGSCATCHGVTATPKPSGHLITTESCDACHTTNAWLPAGGHGATAPTPGTCYGCHVSDMPGGHFVLASARSCDQCHYDDRPWLPIKGFDHNNAYYRAHNSTVTCNSCHNNVEKLVWPNDPDKAFCGGCHKGDYETGPHTKYQNPSDFSYTYDELKDCTSSCHVYNDSTLTPPPVKNRPGKHSPTDGGF